ncbi:carboxylate-amine ligase [Rhodomicrobium vannielii ATCC 17100]|nr:carboxylate-amine ligase [Rhodomicrobium vannielii ATCC 17100]
MPHGFACRLEAMPVPFQYNIGTLDKERKNHGKARLSGANGVNFEPVELARSKVLQDHFRETYAKIFADPNTPRTVVIVPSITFDREVMARIAGVHHYEERLLCLLLLLRFPRTRVIYVTSTPIATPIIDYYLHLLPGIPAQHAKKRLVLLSCYDSSDAPLSAKILARPRLIERIKAAIPDPHAAHVTFFTVTPLEKKLALKLDLPIYGSDPEVSCWGSKSGSRKIFKEAGIAMPAGFEDLKNADDIVNALVTLKERNPALRRAVVKLNDGFSGEGNAVFCFEGAPETGLRDWVHEQLPHLGFQSAEMTFDAFMEKFELMGGIAEEFLEGKIKRSPSSQFRVDPMGTLETISTHDQVLGGANEQVFLGCKFPADESYRLDIQELGRRAGEVLASKGALGRFAIDFMSVKDDEDAPWRHYAIEINLRKGGTTHPFLMLQYLTAGRYERETGLFYSAAGKPCFYYASDNLHADHYRGLTPTDLIDIAATQGLHFDAAKQEGVVFHLVGALSEFGKLGVLAIGDTQEKAYQSYMRSVAILDEEGTRHDGD